MAVGSVRISAGSKRASLISTGPIARGDLETIGKHRQALTDYAPELGELYRLLGWYTAEMINNEEIKQYFES